MKEVRNCNKTKSGNLQNKQQDLLGFGGDSQLSAPVIRDSWWWRAVALRDNYLLLLLGFNLQRPSLLFATRSSSFFSSGATTNKLVVAATGLASSQIR